MSAITFCWWKGFPPKEAQQLQNRMVEQITSRFHFDGAPAIETEYTDSVSLSVSVSAPCTACNLQAKLELMHRVRQRNVPVTIHLY